MWVNLMAPFSLFRAWHLFSLAFFLLGLTATRSSKKISVKFECSSHGVSAPRALKLGARPHKSALVQVETSPAPRGGLRPGHDQAQDGAVL